jgi:hypothetical protein
VSVGEDSEWRVVEGRRQWSRQGRWFEWQAEIAPEADLGEPTVVSGEVFRLRPLAADAEQLQRMARALEVEGDAVFDLDEWRIDDPRGYQLTLGEQGDADIPSLVGRQVFEDRQVSAERTPRDSPVASWGSGADDQARLDWVGDLLVQFGIAHRDWVAASLPEAHRSVVLRPRAGGLVAGQGEGTGANYWHFNLTGSEVGLDWVEGRVTDLESVATLPLLGAERSMADFLRGDLAPIVGGFQRMVRAEPSDPAHTQWIKGVHMELAEIRRRRPDGQMTIALVPAYAFSGEHITADGQRTGVARPGMWGQMGGQVVLPAVDWDEAMAATHEACRSLSEEGD